MTRIVSGLLVLVFLAACGADGMPTKPEPREISNEPSGPVDIMAPAS